MSKIKSFVDRAACIYDVAHAVARQNYDSSNTNELLHAAILLELIDEVKALREAITAKELPQ